MDRLIVYPGAIPLDTDILNTERNAMIGLSKLTAAVLGTSTLVNGLVCGPTAPASLSVSVSAGEIYALTNLDGTAYGSLPVDTTHQIMKQGIALDATILSCPAPSTGGFSTNYLIEAAYQDSDTNPIVLPYYNASNPAQAYSGPNNSGVAQNTFRKGIVSLIAKAGVAAATGTQTTPAADAGYVGLWVVTVANGQGTITGGNIVQAVGAPVITNTLTTLAPLASPAFTGNPTAPTQAPGDNSTKLATTAFVKANTSSGGLLATINFTAQTQALTSISNANPAVFTVTSAKHLPENGSPIQLTTSGVLPAPLALTTTYWVVNASGSTYNVAATKGGAAIATTNAGSGTHTMNSVYVKNAGSSYITYEAWGAGAGGGGISSAAGVAGGGGGAGGYVFGTLLAANVSATETITIGAGGTAGANTGGTGGTGGTTSFGSHGSATGGAGGVGSSTAGSAVSGGAGGVGTGGDLNYTGPVGTGGDSTAAASAQISGAGGATTIGGNGKGHGVTSDGASAGTDAVNNSGSGGGGAVNNTAAAALGGVGGSGRVIIREYS